MVDAAMDCIEEGEKEFEKKRRAKPKKESVEKTNNELEFTDLDEKRESLSILATLDQTKYYLGKQMCAADVHKLRPSEVEKYFRLYQCKLGKETTDSLMKGGLRMLASLASKIVKIDDVDSMVDDVLANKLVERELGSAVGGIALKGGRYVALLSGLISVFKHVKGFLSEDVIVIDKENDDVNKEEEIAANEECIVEEKEEVLEGRRRRRR